MSIVLVNPIATNGSTITCRNIIHIQ